LVLPLKEKAYSFSDTEFPELVGALSIASGVPVNAKSALRVPAGVIVG
jgi:hypothetical protein